MGAVDTNLNAATSAGPVRPYAAAPGADFQEHLARLQAHGLVFRIDEPVNKDTELHPLVRWQFRGGVPEAERRAFLFTNVVDSLGRRYDIPVVVGALAASATIYRIGIGAESIEAIGPALNRAVASPIPPQTISEGAQCQEVLHVGEDLRGVGKGLDRLPVPISTPGFDCSPYLTATSVITRDPETGVQNIGTYRASLRAPDRLAVMIASVNGGHKHWKKWRDRGEAMPVAIVIGCPPPVSYASAMKLREGLDELAVAGGLIGAPVTAVRGRTVDLLVPAQAEIVIEGLIRPDEFEPEGPFGESHGHVALEDYNFIMDVTAITHRRNPVFASIISQVTPSESSVIKRVAMEPMFLSHLRDTLGLHGVRRVVMHEPLTNLRPVIIVQFAAGTASSEVWRGLLGTTSLNSECGKIVIAVSDDIDAASTDALLWSMAYRSVPELDVEVIGHRSKGHGVRVDRRTTTDSALLIDATRKGPTPPLALPKPEYMENARRLWERLGLPPLTPQSPWHGYDMGLWSIAWERTALQAVAGHYLENGAASYERRRRDVTPNSPVSSGD
jgi:4-hydroxy-3-polyprenylbenzoate decarboxylase